MQTDLTKRAEVSGVEKIAETLRRAIFKGAFLPGDQLKEVELSRSLGVSRGSVREALRILSTEELVVHLPNKGASVRKLSLDEIDDIFLTRHILEIKACECISTAPDHLLRALEDSTSAYEAVANQDDQVVIANAHINYHKALVGLTGSLKLVELEESLMQTLQVIIACIENDRDDTQNEVANHRQMTEMVLAGDVEGAKKWVDDYIPNGKDFVIDQIRSQEQAPRLGRR
ncbi:transcriptional regulator, GntR family [Pseudodesulfovibrio mercurii]|uniref:Transcriptional regulator, GntR family n=1 Tax=Pseudodesulfovibrio mercurii TaxID=641491 RepID=F0JK93_9BACT|nr:GntR family transcriptional regulator [Pseudodesulfovibrio mercurii]EGB16342.1 transcriptional regulator, GntR family [Pseudodesulfovibrio mercurii]